jgi:hypothetical protein
MPETGVTATGDLLPLAGEMRKRARDDNCRERICWKGETSVASTCWRDQKRQGERRSVAQDKVQVRHSREGSGGGMQALIDAGLVKVDFIAPGETNLPQPPTDSVKSKKHIQKKDDKNTSLECNTRKTPVQE